MNYDDIYKKIRQIRIEKGFSQKAIGEKCGLTQQAINRIEQGQRRIDLDLLVKMASALSVQVADLIYIPPEEPDGVSPEHPIAFSGLEKKLSEIGYHIGYGCDYVEYSDNDIWIEYPDGKKLFISLAELENLNLETDMYLKFRIEQLRDKKK